jgi:hypothetical protein
VHALTNLNHFNPSSSLHCRRRRLQETPLKSCSVLYSYVCAGGL